MATGNTDLRELTTEEIEVVSGSGKPATGTRSYLVFKFEDVAITGVGSNDTVLKGPLYSGGPA